MNKEEISTITSVVSARDFRGDNVFMKTLNDDQIRLSVEDRKFIGLMTSSFRKDEEGFWTAPLPFKQIPDQLPKNKAQAYHRAKNSAHQPSKGSCENRAVCNFYAESVR